MKSDVGSLARPLRGIIPPMVTPLADRDALDVHWTQVYRGTDYVAARIERHREMLREGTPLAAILHRFAYLKYALSVLLVFIGSKIFVADLMGWEKFPPEWSLGITFAILGAGMGFSLWKTGVPKAGKASSALKTGA